jgi:hypothetical protein
MAAATAREASDACTVAWPLSLDRGRTPQPVQPGQHTKAPATNRGRAPGPDPVFKIVTFVINGSCLSSFLAVRRACPADSAARRGGRWRRCAGGRRLT